MELTHISLFTGIGGNEIAAEWAGFKTVLQCEIDPYCRSILSKHFPGIPIIEDVKNVTYTRITESGRLSGIGRETVSTIGNTSKAIADSECLGRQAGAGNRVQSALQVAERQEFNDIRNQRKGLPRRISLLTAGVPCQPASTAGKQRGKNDDRWLWPEAIRVLSELQPAWAVFENPTGIISLDEFGSAFDMEGKAANPIPDEYAGGLDEICSDIEKRGYEVQPVLIPACAVNAYHRRDRVFIIAHALGVQRQPGCSRERERELAKENQRGRSTLADSESIGRQLTGSSRKRRAGFKNGSPNWYGGEWGQPNPLEDNKLSPSFVEWLMGFPKDWTIPGTRVQRLKALGNAVVPEQCYPIYKAIADIERGNR